MDTLILLLGLCGVLFISYWVGSLIVDNDGNLRFKTKFSDKKIKKTLPNQKTKEEKNDNIR